MRPTADEVIEALREEVRALCPDCKTPAQSGTRNGYTCQLHFDLLSAALDLARRYRDWRRLSEEQPADGQRCLIWTGASFKIAQYDATRGDFFLGIVGWMKATHWQPLPEPPKETQ